jgi:hypothetical protein
MLHAQKCIPLEKYGNLFMNVMKNFIRITYIKV